MRVSLTNLGPAALKQAYEQIQAQSPIENKRRKFGNVPTEYKSVQGFTRTYDSKLEARYAAIYDKGVETGLVKWWLPQPIFPLPGGVKYRGDFLVVWTDGRVSIADAKGKDTQSSINKRKQVKELYGIDVEILA